MPAIAAIDNETLDHLTIDVGRTFKGNLEIALRRQGNATIDENART